MRRKTMYAFFILFSFISLCTLPSYAQEKVDFWYGLSFKANDSSNLPKPSVPFNMAYDGLTVTIDNMTEIDDSLMILCVADMKIIPFSCENSASKKVHQFDISGMESKVLDIKFDDRILAKIEKEAFPLHFILIGLLNHFPKNEFDNMLFYGLTTSLPISGNEGKINSNNQPVAIANRPLQTGEEEKYLNHFGFYNKETGTKFPIIHNSVSSNVEILFSVIGNTDQAIILFFLDNELIPIGEDDGLKFQMNQGYAFDFALNLNLAKGVHQLYALYVPCTQAADAFNTSEKLVINIP